MNEKYLAIIPARGGSKRIPGKNIRLFLGVPIIKYSIDAAINSKIFDEIIVSTDDKKIAYLSQSSGAKVPFFRSTGASGDYAATADVVLEVLREYRKRGKEFEYFCCIYPAAPFVSAEKLISAIKILKKTNADAVIPVVSFSYPIQRALKYENGLLKMFWPENLNKRSQDLEPVYHDTGQFYWLKTSSFLVQKKIFAKNTVPLRVSELETQDIDSEEDWKIAEIKYRMIKEKINNGRI